MLCCAAGWAVYLQNRSLYNKLMKEELGSLAPPWVENAFEALNLKVPKDMGESLRLFGTIGNWPEPFAGAYYYAPTAAGRAKAMAARWEHFIATDGVE